jgi:hypothetical protein
MYENDKIAQVEKQLDELRLASEQRALEASLKVTADQSAKLVQLTRSGLSPQEALTVARGRDPAAFDALGDDKKGFQPFHGSLRPNGGGGAPQPETLKQKAAAVRALVGKIPPHEVDAAEKKLHGSIVIDMIAKQMGWKARP